MDGPGRVMVAYRHSKLGAQLFELKLGILGVALQLVSDGLALRPDRPDPLFCIYKR